VQVFWRDDNNAPQQANQQAMQQQAPQTIPAGDDKFDDDIPF
jgi:hypothetical protein